MAPVAPLDLVAFAAVVAGCILAVDRQTGQTDRLWIVDVEDRVWLRFVFDNTWSADWLRAPLLLHATTDLSVKLISTVAQQQEQQSGFDRRQTVRVISGDYYCSRSSAPRV